MGRIILTELWKVTEILQIIVNNSKNFEFWYSFNDEKPWMNKQLNLKKHKCKSLPQNLKKK